MVPVSGGGTVVFFNADTTPQTVLIQDAAGGMNVLGPIGPGQVSRVVTFTAPGQYRFSNPERAGMQGWAQVD
jgi:plastocyanin